MRTKREQFTLDLALSCLFVKYPIPDTSLATSSSRETYCRIREKLVFCYWQSGDIGADTKSWALSSTAPWNKEDVWRKKSGRVGALRHGSFSTSQKYVPWVKSSRFRFNSPADSL